MYMQKTNPHIQYTVNPVQHIEIARYEALFLNAWSRGKNYANDGKKFRINKKEYASL